MGIVVSIADDLEGMQYALSLAHQAAAENEVPVGAIVVLEKEIIGQGYNQSLKKNDPTAHAEIIALRQAAKKLGNYRLLNTTLYVSLEPCHMCAGSLIHARVNRLVFGAYDQKAGAVQSTLCLYDLPHNHQVRWQGGVLAHECTEVLQNFFRARR
jgi:tRNA(adenine34) deaminase